VIPILIIHQNSGYSLGWLDFAGLIMWLIGFYFEYVGDSQLASFIKNPQNKGRLMQSGLWAYTRHPNYFGEVTQWWGLFLIALSVPSGIFSVIGPITITFLIVKISGIPMLEKKMAEKPEFAEYERKVSKFFPLPRKK
jgi:steroid 5-alpha reductase family enzyme